MTTRSAYETLPAEDSIRSARAAATFFRAALSASFGSRFCACLRPSGGPSLRAFFAAAGVGFVLLAIGCASAPVERPIPADLDARADLIVQVEAEIAANRRALEDLVTHAKDENAAELHDDPTLRRLSGRLSANARFLNRLKRPAAPSPSPPPASDSDATEALPAQPPEMGDDPRRRRRPAKHP